MNFSSFPVLYAPVLYLDPGTGSFLIQLLLAAVLGIGVATRLYWSKIKTLFRGKKVETTKAPEDQDEI